MGGKDGAVNSPLKHVDMNWKSIEREVGKGEETAALNEENSFELVMQLQRAGGQLVFYSD